MNLDNILEELKSEAFPLLKAVKMQAFCRDYITTVTPELNFPVDCGHLRYLTEWVCVKGDYPYKECPLCEGSEYPRAEGSNSHFSTHGKIPKDLSKNGQMPETGQDVTTIDTGNFLVLTALQEGCFQGTRYQAGDRLKVSLPDAQELIKQAQLRCKQNYQRY